MELRDIYGFKKVKRDYYVKSANNIDDPEEVYKKLDEVNGRNAAFSEPIYIEKDGVVVDDPQEVAEIFNEFYQEKVCASLAH